jgi:hypothetical protein
MSAVHKYECQRGMQNLKQNIRKICALQFQAMYRAVRDISWMAALNRPYRIHCGTMTDTSPPYIVSC